MDARRKVFVVLGAIAVIGTASLGGGALFFAKGGNSLAVQPTASQASISRSTVTSGSSYKDGTYSATSSYFVPRGNENSIKTSLTVSGGTVTAVSVKDNYADDQSAAYVDWFEQELQNSVVGKSLADLSPSRIGGASLTTFAFDQTLDTIKNDATA